MSRGPTLHRKRAKSYRNAGRRRDQLEKVCRYILRPPLAVARLTESTGGQLLYHFRRPWRDGSTALVLEPLELLGERADRGAGEGDRKRG